MSRPGARGPWALVILLLGGGLGARAAQGTPAGPVTVVLGADTTRVELGSRLEYLEDPTGRLTLEDIRAPGTSARFRPSPKAVPNFGFSPSVYWFRVRLHNQDSHRREWLLEVGYPMLDRIDLWVGGAGDAFTHRVAGDHLPFGRREIKHRNFVFVLEQGPGQRQWVILRVKTESSVQLPLAIYTPKAFLAQDHEAQAALWLFYGIMLVMVLYNFFIFLSIRDRTYGYYVLYILGSMSFQMSLNGLAFEVLWPNAVWWANICVPFLLGFATLFACQFARSFVTTRAQFPRLDKVLIGWMGVAGIGMLLALFGPYRLAIQWTVIGVSLAVVLILSTAGYATRRGFRPARYLFIAWVVFCAGVFLHSMRAFGLLPTNFFTSYGNNLGSALEAMLLSFALADRINVLKAERAAAQARALESERRSLEVEREAKANLEAEVDRQTEALREANRRLQEVDRQKTRFFQNISHELRSPLTVILNPIEQLLASGHQGPPALRLPDKLQAMERNAHRLLRLVNQLLDFARLESGRATVSFESRDLGAFLQPIVDSFQIFAAAKELRLELRAAEGLPEVYVDAEKLDTVVCNLLSNACKFTPAGGSVLVRVLVDEAAARIVVRDKGIGIPEDQLPRIFERFHQVESTAHQPYQGTGIGLALARELAEAMGAALTVESEVGFGTTFTVALPLGTAHIADPGSIRAGGADGDAPPEAVSRARQAVGALAAETGIRAGRGADASESLALAGGGRPGVLVVEDSPDMRDLVADLCREHFDVHAVGDGEAALEWLREQGDETLPALVISDVMMPRMDGHELLTQLRRERRTAGIPVMLLTAKAGPERRIEGLESGADDYLTKPFDARELRARALNLVRLKDQEQQLRRLNERLAGLNAELAEDVSQEARAGERARSLGRFLAPTVEAAILAEGAAESAVLAPDRRRLTLLRLELRGLGGLTDVLEPEELARVWGDYLTVVLRLAYQHGAILDTVAFERVSGFLGAPHSEGAKGDAEAGMRLALGLHEELGRLAARWEQELECARVEPAIALHTGYATVGSFDTEERRTYAAVGGAVHEASGLIGQAGPGVLCSQTTWVLLEGTAEGAPCGELRLRRHGEAVRVYRLAGEGPDYSALQTPRGEASLEGIFAPGESGRLAPLLAMFSTLELREGVLVADRYTIRGRLGGGGMGTVYRALDRKLESDVALKLIRPDLVADAERVKRLRQEVSLSRKITHRNVARIFDIGEWPGGELISMELLEGVTLERRLRDGGPLPEAELREVLRQVCAGLAAAHAVGVIHRDLKPSNVMVEADGRVVILDFGIARAMAGTEPSQPETRELIGTPHYCAPEQVRGGKVDQRADLYAVGAMAFEMATGQTVFQGDTLMALAFQHATEPPPDPRPLAPGLPEDLARLILRCLEKEPDARFSSAEALAAALAAPG